MKKFKYAATPTKTEITVMASNQIEAVKKAAKKLTAKDREVCNQLRLISITPAIAATNEST